VIRSALALALVCASPAAAAPERLTIPGAPALGPYSPVVRAGGFVFVSGVIPYDHARQTFAPADMESQVRQALANLDAALKAAGLTRADVVKTTVYLRDSADMPVMNRLYAEFFGAALPARTTVPGLDWGRPDLRIEIEAVALDPRSSRR
jgi:2-iminobutanoate/2-iminopropanoate deaminase